MVDRPNTGTLPDFGNFRISADREYDRYEGMEELMPFARGVSAKSYDFDRDGNETTIDFARMIQIVKKSGYRGYIGIECEGEAFTEDEGIMLTKRLLERLI
jgi:sugar phosphate isomerase/epimerase